MGTVNVYLAAMPESTSPWSSFSLGIILGAFGMLFALATNAQRFQPNDHTTPKSLGHELENVENTSTCLKRTQIERIEEGIQANSNRTASDQPYDPSMLPSFSLGLHKESSLEPIDLTPSPLETTVNIDDLHDFEDYVYCKTAKLPYKLRNIPEDPALRAALRLILECFVRIPSSGNEHRGFATDPSRPHMEILVQFLRVFMCRYAVSKNIIATLDIHCQHDLGDDSLSLLAEDVMGHHDRRLLIPIMQHIHRRSNRLGLFREAVRRGCTELAQDVYRSFSRPPTSSAPECPGISRAELTSALFDAARYGRSGTARWLLVMGADLFAVQQDPDICTPLTTAIRIGSCDVIELFIQRGAKLKEIDHRIDPLWTAWQYGRPSSIHCLMKHGVVVGQSSTDPPMQDLLKLAVSKNHSSLADICLEAGVDPDTRDTERFGYGTLFQRACGLGEADVVSVFLKHGVDFEALQKSFANGYEKSNKPIYVAASSGHSAVVRVLLEHGAKADLQYMVFWAVHVGYADLLECLFKYGDVHSRCSQYLDEALAHLAEHLDGKRTWYPATARFPAMIRFLIAQGGKASSDHHWDLCRDWTGHTLEQMGFKDHDAFLAFTSSLGV